MITLLFKSRWAAARDLPPGEPQPGAARPLPDDDAPLDDDGKRDRWWYESSYELRHGLDVDDDVASTMPGELIDRLFKR